MSHSQFHKYKLLILRHAWLSPSDKHMTTGRINQVSILLVFSCCFLAIATKVNQECFTMCSTAQEKKHSCVSNASHSSTSLRRQTHAAFYPPF